MKKLINQKEIQVLDKVTGELLELTILKTFSIKSPSESFWVTFLDYIAPLYGLNTKADAKDVLTLLLEMSEYNTGKIFLSRERRLEICNKLGISNAGLTNHLRKLRDHNLISGNHSDYLINPLIFWKGSFSARQELLNKCKLLMTFDLIMPDEANKDVIKND